MQKQRKPLDELLTRHEAAARLHMGLRTLDKLVHEQKIEHLRIRGAVRFTRAALAAYIESCKVPVKD